MTETIINIIKTYGVSIGSRRLKLEHEHSDYDFCIENRYCGHFN